MKLANPIYYPTAVFVGGACLVVGLRVLGLSDKIVLPTAIAAAVLTSTALKAREPDEKEREKLQFQQEVEDLKSAAEMVATKAEELRREADQLLTASSLQIDLLVAVQQACDRAIELPQKIDDIARTFPANRALLSAEELERQLLEVQHKLRSSSGISRQHLEELKSSLERNIQLVNAGQDTRQIKLINLQKIIQDSLGVLQQLQNKLRTSDLNNSADIRELQKLSDELKAHQENVEILTRPPLPDWS